MRNVLIVMFMGTSFFFCLPAGAIAEEHGDFEVDRAVQHMEIQERQMELEQNRREMEHDHQMRQLQLEREHAEMRAFEHGGHKDKFMPLILLCVVVHILVAVWVYQDIRTRGAGAGIWIVIALLAGLPGVLVYAVVRLGDMKQT
ncbi:MAG: hypothetical protein ACYTET_01065 [Planctomycetota bacterium]|jgi:uncharacterized membrane protein (DUF106 family)